MIIMAIVAIVGGLILRIESVVTCESIVIVLKTHLTLDRASTTAATTTTTTTTTTTLVATSTLIITTTRNPRIRGILVCICHIGIRGRIRARIIISYGLRRVSMADDDSVSNSSSNTNMTYANQYSSDSRDSGG